MKITCQTCDAKYTIADEKVAGKVVKIRCKKCNGTIVVNGNQAAPAPAPLPAFPSLASAFDDDEDGATRVFSDPSQTFGMGFGAPKPAAAAPAQAAPAPRSDAWTVSASDDDSRTMTTAELTAAIANGAVRGDAFVWKDGMGDWKTVADLAELRAFLPAAKPQEAPQEDLNSTMAMDSPMSPFANLGPAGAQRTDARPAGPDLFASSAQATQNTSGAGARSENSVLFSLKSLSASEEAAKATKGRDQGVLDLGPSRAPAASSGLDDIMNLGGGSFGGPIQNFAPPPLLAPVIDAPPMMVPGMHAAGAPLYGAPLGMPQAAAPAKKSPMGIIIGAVLGVALLGGGGFFAWKSMHRGTDAAPPAPVAVAPIATPTAAAQPAASSTAVAQAATPTAASPDVAPTPAKPDAKPDTKTDSKADTKVAVADTSTGSKTATPAAAPSAKPEAKPAAEEPAATGNEFNRGAAAAALGGAASSARSCKKKPDDPSGTGRVKVTFAPSGKVTTANIEGPPFAGTSTGGCIAALFRGAHVPAFDGAAVSVTKSFTIN